ncbi:MAG TPA: hypothetical protein QF646_07515 [Candidatus Poseidoniales archaeon]|nr:hypothetical protein [Candidatus Poseidoniales archaeon]
MDALGLSLSTMLSTPAERLLDDLHGMRGVHAVLLIDREGLCTSTRPYDFVVGAERSGLLSALSAEATLNAEYDVIVTTFDGGGCLLAPLNEGRSLCVITEVNINLGAVRKGLIEISARLRPLMGASRGQESH